MNAQTPAATAQALQPLHFPLRGSQLIEASAGTGKTWTIAALYLRLVLGHGPDEASAPPRALLPQEVLVMTFTRAATRELSDRIRARLNEAARVFRGQLSTDDAFLNGLCAAYPDGPAREQAAYRLALAAQAMDDASVYTIDAWCQRMLREHALGSGSLFDEQLLADEAALRLQAVQDYWRQALYPMPTAQVAQVQAIWADVAALEQDLRALLAVPLPEPEDGTLAQLLAQVHAERQAQLRALKAGWDEAADRLLAWVQAQLAPAKHGWDGRRLQLARCSEWLGVLKAWAQGEGDAQALEDGMKAGWQRFTPEGLYSCRKADQPLPELPPESAAFAQLQEALRALPDPVQSARLHARARVRERMAELKRRSGQFGFADMLERLEHALADPQHGARLAQRLREQFPVALIDEFQDTSPLQFRLFDRIYHCADNRQDSALLLIGDPKQSIYGFRGADIQSYLAARRATAGRHHVLGTNHRSTVAMVEVVNRWFQLREDAFDYRQGDDDPMPFVPVRARGRDEVLHTTEGPLPAMTVVHDAVLRSTREAQAHLSALCAEQIVAWLSDPQARFVDPQQGDRPLQPKDIAVLVRTGKEAAAVREALSARGVASVYLSDRDSVFASEEAKDLCLWLRGVAEPQDMRRVRAALGTRTVGLSLAELHALATDDTLLEQRAEQMRALQLTWQNQGVLAMLRQALHGLQLAARWRGEPDGERRLTNVLHLAELLQAASSQLDGEQALLRWLVQQIEQADSGALGEGEEQTLRLESDDDLVKVVTIHKSKGLEYPVVCLPFAHSHRVVQAHRASVLALEPTQADGERRWTLQFDARDAKAADRERLREDLRLWYVALTRARHALWLGWSLVRRGNGQEVVNQDSAAGHLLSGEPAQAQDWPARWQRLLTNAQAQPLSVCLREASSPVPLTPWSRPQASAPLREALVCSARIDKRWTIASFSRLARDLSSQAVLPMAVPRPADDEPLEAMQAEAHELPPQTAAPPWHRFARGPSAGNFLHDQLEWLAGEGFALDDARSHRLRQRCERAGHAAQADALVDWFSRVLAQPLTGPQAPLSALHTLLPEMEFWLPAQRLHAREIDALCRQHLLPGVPRPQLPDAQLHGMLMGFADLVFEHQGRYWVLDYKSNHLGPDDSAYSADALGQAMAEHRYDVQAALYLLALHRLLRARLGVAYEPERQLGGAVYLFLRGIDGPAQGCCTLPAPLPLLQALDAMLGAEAAA